MLLNRTSSVLAVAAIVLALGVPSAAQDLWDAQLFAPANLSPYGGGPSPHEGYFFTFDGLNWNISAPDVTTIGDPNQTRTVYYGVHPLDDLDPLSDIRIQSNTLDTSPLEAVPTLGNRIEFGRINDHKGWMFGVYRLTSQTQRYMRTGVDMVFIDDEFGPRGSRLLEGIVGTVTDPLDPDTQIDIIRNLPLTFDEVFVRNEVAHWSTELSFIHRTHQLHHGGYFEWLFGARYLQFDETFEVDARGDIFDDTGDDAVDDVAAQVPAILADSIWCTRAENHLIGPQIGLRWFKKCHRFTYNVEGRYMAGFNFQNLRQQGTLGTELNPPGDVFEPLVMDTTSFTHAADEQEYSNVVELRAELRYEFTRNVSFRVGWTGLWMDGIARASNVINYEVPDMGLRPEFNEEDVFMHGLTIGVDVNR